MADKPGDITLLLRKVREGQAESTEELIRLVYVELRRIAAAYLWGERPGHSLQPTALVHEAWLRLADQTKVDWRDRKHFFGVAAQMMRRVLVDHARAHHAGKRGGGAAVLNLEMVDIAATPQKLEEILAIDELLTRLAQFDPQQGQVVEMRYFAGMSVGETAAALGVSSRTVDREWALACAWLRRELSRKGGE